MRNVLGIFAAILLVANTAMALPAVQIVDAGANLVVWDAATRPDGKVLIIGVQNSTGKVFEDADSGARAVLVIVNDDASFYTVELPGLIAGARTAGYSLSANGLAAGGSSDRSFTESAVPVIWDLGNLSSISTPLDLGLPAPLGYENGSGVVFGVADNMLSAVGVIPSYSGGFRWSRESTSDPGSYSMLPLTPDGSAYPDVNAASADLSVLVGRESLDGFTGQAICNRDGVTEPLSQDPYALEDAFSISADGQVIGGYSTYWDLPTGGDSVQNTVFDVDGNFLEGYFYGATDGKWLVGGQNLFLNYDFVTNRNGAIIAFPDFDPAQPGVVVGGNFSQWLRSTFDAGVADVNGTDDDISTILGIYQTPEETGFAAVTFDDGPSGKVGHSYFIRIVDEGPGDPELVETDITPAVSITKTDSVVSTTSTSNVRVRITLRLFGRTFNIDFTAPVVSSVSATNNALIAVTNTAAGQVTAPVNMTVTPTDAGVSGGGTQVLQADGTFEQGQGLAGSVVLTKSASYTLPTGRLTLQEYLNLLSATNSWAQQQTQSVTQYGVAISGQLPAVQ